MLSSLLSNLLWGSQEEPAGSSEAEIEHSTSEEAGDWLVITAARPGEGTGSGSSSDHASLESECERESVCSDNSWIITPGPTFRGTGQHVVGTEAAHPLENLLIEHPTMSVYGQVPGESNGNREEVRAGAVGETQRQADTSERDLQRMRNQTREMVLLRNRQRHQVAVHLQLPLQTGQVDAGESTASAKPPLRVTRKATRRLNLVKHRSTRGKQTYHIKKSTFVAGRRRC